MNLSDKDYREFHDQIWERNKELIKENKKLTQELEETEHARWLCEGNWKRCEQELECAKGDLRTVKDILDQLDDTNIENAQLKADVKRVEYKLKNKEKELSMQNDIVSSYDTRIEVLKERNHDLELANECLVDEIREVLKDNKGLHELYMEEKEKNNNLELTNDSLTKELEDLHSRIDEVCGILMDDEYPPISECIEDLRWEHDPDRKISDILTAEKTEKGITITINSDNIL